MNKLVILIAVALSLAPALRAELKLPAIIGDHMVLQQKQSDSIWGWDTPGTKVTVAFAGQNYDATAGADGKWMVKLSPMAANDTAQTLTISGSSQRVIRDVLIGEVWMCSGQSNMQMALRQSAGGADEIAQSTNPQLRQFKVAIVASAVPLDEVKGQWEVAKPETTPEFTAVGYYFGQIIQRGLNASVGLINASWGGTPIEAWTRKGAYDSDPDLLAGAEKNQADAAHYKAFLSDYRAWVERRGRQDHPPATPAAFNAFAPNATGWKAVNLPSSPTKAGLPEAGAVWICRKVTLPASAVGAGLEVWFGDVADAVKIYWNGVQVGEGGINSIAHRYMVSGKYITSTEGVLSARIVNPTGAPGIIASDKAKFFLNYKDGRIPLEGEWLAKTEYTFPPLPSGTEACPVKALVPRPDQEVAAYIFNGMIHPLIPTAIAGVIWYQGEHNWNRGWQYRTAFPLMIADWRKQWGVDFPFYFCQLPNYQPQSAKPGNATWAEVREGQAAALKLPQTGMAVLLDVGDANNIHPTDKRSVGDRLARLALAKTYGKAVIASGPMFVSSKIEAGKVRVEWSDTAGGLVTKPVAYAVERPESAVQGFAVCGADRQWVWALAQIDGQAVVVWSPKVPAPVAVRYGWADNPVCNLYNDAGLPAAPFRTDDFPAISLNNKY